MKRQTSVKNEVVSCFSAIIVIVLLTQLIFNMFFLKPFVSAVKIASIENSFAELQEVYSDDIDSMRIYARDILEEKGIRLAISKNDDVILMPSTTKERKPIPSEQAARPHKYDPLDDDVFDKAMFSENPEAVIVENNNDSWVILRGKFDYNGDTIYTAMTFYMPTIENRIGFYEYISIGIMIVALFVSIIPAFIFSRSLTKPIIEIEQVAQNVSNLDFTHTANENISSTELASLAKSINTMSTSLQKSIEDLQVANEKLQHDIDYKNQAQEMQRAFIANVSHEMKTPLGILQLYCENLKSNIEGIDKDYYYDVIVSETQKLNRMVVEMLDISSIEKGIIDLHHTDFCLSDMCSVYISKIKNVYREREIAADIQPDVYVNGDPVYVEKALANYMNNALTYATEGTEIEISLKTEGNLAKLCTFNKYDVPEHTDIERIWEPFYRSEQARTRTEDNNVGLGLSIVKSIIEKHNGSVGVETRDDGVEFSFSLPVVDHEI